MKGKPIGLAIVYDYPDYGSMLQALATQLTVDNLSYESLAINVAPLKGDIAKRKYKYFAENILDFTIVKEKSKIIGKKLRCKFDKRLGHNQAIREEAFRKFRQAHFHETKPYQSWQALHEGSREFGSVIVGSDQLWLPSNVAADFYTLSWVADDVNKICYATSFGIGAIPEKYKQRYEKFLSRIENLSARETSGQTIIKDSTRRDVPLVCDPAMLLTAAEWDKVEKEEFHVDEPYVFCYFMGDNPEQRSFARRLADAHGCKVVSLLHLDRYIASDENYADYTPYDLSPAGFINLVKNARYVCTDSFHGTVFSILYGKDFFTFKRFNKKASLSTNTRIYSLLDRLELRGRLFTADENPAQDWHIDNYDEIHRRVADFRAESFRYLQNALNSSKL